MPTTAPEKLTPKGRATRERIVAAAAELMSQISPKPTRSPARRSHGEVDNLALAMLAAIQGGLLLSQVRRDTAPLEAAVDTMIEHLRDLGVQ
jgi:hypothetical protein